MEQQAYSKITYVELTNFMCFPYARIEADETGIINLVGYNDSGKSTVTRAVSILLYDTDPTSQASEIRDGESEFEIRMGFDDGVEISKIKRTNGNSIWYLRRHDEVIYTNQNGNAVIAVSGVPDPIAQYLNVASEEITKSKLNVRTRNDKLFLIGTGGADNYKMLNSQLNCEVLTQATNAMKEDRNRTQNMIAEMSSEISINKEELARLDVVDETTILEFKDLTNKLKMKTYQYEELMHIFELQDKISQIAVYDELALVDTSRHESIMGIRQLQAMIEGIVVADEVPVVDAGQYQMLLNLLGLHKQTQVLYPDEDVDMVRMDQHRDIQEIVRLYNQYTNIYNQEMTVINDFNVIMQQLHDLSVEHNFKMCKNCGSVVV